MVERRSTRTVNKESATQVAVSSKRAARSTRSQSKDVTEDERTERRGQKGRSKTAGPTSGKAVATGQQGQGLSSVDEESISNEPQSVETSNESSEEAKRNRKSATTRSSGGRSAFSGTTARASGSFPDMNDPLLTDMTAENLPDLWQNSKKLLRALIPEGATRETFTNLNALALDLRTSKESKTPPKLAGSKRLYANLSRYRKALQNELDYWNPQAPDATFIDVAGVVASLCGPQSAQMNGNEALRPESVIHLVNFAKLADNTFSYPLQIDQNFLANLDSHYPHAFLSNSESGAREVREIFILGLEIRTQNVIAQISNNISRPNFDQDDIIYQLFFEKGNAIRGWNFEGLETETLGEPFEQMLVARIDQMTSITHEMSEEEEHEAALKLLQEKFSWSNFAFRIMQWIECHCSVIETRIRAAGGIDSIVQAIKSHGTGQIGSEAANDSRDAISEREEHNRQLQHQSPGLETSVQRRKGSSSNRDPMTAFRSPIFSTNSALSLQAAAAMKARKALGSSALRPPVPTTSNAAQNPELESATSRNLRTRSPQQADRLQENPVEEDDWQPQDLPSNEDEDEDEEAFERRAIPDPRIAQVLDARDRDQAESNKENQALPAAAAAKRARLIDAQLGAQKASWNSQNEDSTSQSQISQDQGFGQAPHRRSQQSLRKRGPATRPSISGRQPKRPAVVATTRPQNTRPVDLPRDREPSGSMVASIASQARRGRISFEPKLPQTRKEWTADETNRLIEWISDHGTGWAALKRWDENNGNILERRSDVGLKDKARNLKVNFLLHARHLPPNFEHVRLGKKEIDIVQGQGIEYDPETGGRVDAIWD